jgi:hypothetical protein
MDRVANGRSRIDRRPKTDPRRANVSDRLMRFSMTDYAVGVQRGENRNECGAGRCGNGNQLYRVPYPLGSFCGIHDLGHCLKDYNRPSAVTVFFALSAGLAAWPAWLWKAQFQGPLA